MGKGKSILFAAAVGVFGLGVATLNAEPPKTTPSNTPPANTQPTGNTPAKHDAKKDEKKEQKKDTGATAAGAKIGHAAPAFTLTSADGKTVNLSDFKGKIVVLEWFNPECPVVVGHYKAGTFKTLTDKYASNKDVVFLGINSGGKGQQGYGKDLNAKMAKEWNITHPILLDEDGKVGKAYGAKTTPHMFVINKDGNLAYMGAIDDGKPGAPGKTNYVAAALDSLIKGETVATPETKSYGCSVKYAN
jgi:peroxiredoxin